MPSSYRWFILALVVLTATLVVAAPMMALPVLFKEISRSRYNLRRPWMLPILLTPP